MKNDLTAQKAVDPAMSKEKYYREKFRFSEIIR